MNNRFSLAQAFIDAEKKDYETTDPTQVWETSAKFDSSMQTLINKEKRFTWRCLNTAGKKVAAVVLIFLLLSGSAMSVEAIRTPILNFVIEIYETFTHLFFDETLQVAPPESIEQTQAPTYMINGYNKSEEYSDLLTYKLRFINNTEDEIVYQQSTLANYNAIIDTETTPSEQVSTEFGEALYFKSHNKHTLIWNNGFYAFKLTCPISVTFEELIKLANSVE